MAARSAAAASGPNWRLLSKLAVGAVLVGVTFMIAPMLVCFVMDVAGLEVDGIAAPGAGNFGRRLGSAFTACGERYSPIGAPVWQHVLVASGLVLAVLFSAFGRVSHRRQVRLAAAKQRQARKSLRKERLSRPTGDEGFDVVPRPTTSATGAAIADSSGLTTLGAPMDDPLAALDAEMSRGGDENAPPPSSVIGGTLDNLPSLDQLAPEDEEWEAASDGWESFDDEPVLTGQHVTVSESVGASPEETATMETMPPNAGPGALGEVSTAPPPPASLAEESTAPPSARGWGSGANVAEAETAPPGFDPFGDDTSLSLAGAEFVAPVHIGSEFAIAIRGTGLAAFASDVKLALSVRTLTAQTIPVWTTARNLATAGTYSPGPRGATLRVAWSELDEVVRNVARQEDDGVVEIQMSITAGERTMRVSSPVLDSLTVVFRMADGSPIEPRTALVTSPDGRVARAWIGARVPGQLEMDDLEPGRCRIELEDGSFIGHHGGGLHRSLHLTTNGVSFSDGGEAHTLWLMEPAVVYASTFSDVAEGDGSRGAPFASINDAIAYVAERRRAGDENFACAEIRLDPTARLPSNRHGLAPGDGGRQWQQWWAEQPADPGIDWCIDDNLDALREAATPTTAIGFTEELHIERMDDLRIVNSAYAGLMDRIARSPGFQTHLGEELAAIPLALVAAPETGPAAGFRIVIEGSSRVHVEGLHVLGCHAQSGVSVRDCRAVTLRRCWIDLFSAGANPATGIHAVGRGVQIDSSGGSTVNSAVVVETCDIGWNRAARRAVAVPGAGLSVFESNVEIRHCHVHHNTSTGDPPALVARGGAKVKGSDNHRAHNRVVAV